MSDDRFRPWAAADGRTDDEAFRPSWTVPEEEEPAANDSATPDDPFALGFAAGRASAEAAFDEDRRAMASLVAAAEAMRPEPPEALAQILAEIVYGLAEAVVRKAAIDPEFILDHARAAAALVLPEDAPCRLVLHPADAALLQSDAIDLPIAEDAEQPRGSMRIDCAAGTIEAGLLPRLQMWREQLGLKELH